MTETAQNFKTWSSEKVSHFEWLAQEKMPTPGLEPKKLIGAMRYAVLGGGKRIRVLLCAAAAEVTQAPQAVTDAASLALECIHGYSLVHDDMPCMDNDTLRRGKPTVHVRYGEAMAMLAGDALQTEAFRFIALAPAEPAVVARLVATLAQASGVYGMCGGQALDLAMVGEAPDERALELMQSMKTGALIRAAVIMGAQAGRWDALLPATQGALVVYGNTLGLAFQIVDDILDCTQDTATLGKTAGKDMKDDKPTWVSLLGLDGAKARAARLHDTARAALATIQADPSVPAGAADRLAQIADYVINRTH